jgi:hypothetical protein
MTTDTLIAGFAVLVSLLAAYFSWRAATRSNELSRINALVALRDHYSTAFRRHAEFAEQHRGMASAVQSAGQAAGEAADRLRVIDAKLSGHYERLVNDVRA